MSEITYTLLSDGSSDRALLSIIDWTIRQHFPELVVQRQWADFSRLPHPPPLSRLTERIQQALSLYPCDWLFVHRDAERQPIEDRQEEIAIAWATVGKQPENRCAISIIPVRMTEAWLLIDEQAIRIAAGNPSGRQDIILPSIHMLEIIPDPKQKLHHLLKEASGLHGRRLQNFHVPRAVQLVADNIVDYSPLRALNAFTVFEESIQTLIDV